jgi:hypothetical protein
MRLLKWLVGGALMSFSLFALSLHFGKIEMNFHFGAPAIAPKPSRAVDEKPAVVFVPDEQCYATYRHVMTGKTYTGSGSLELFAEGLAQLNCEEVHGKSVPVHGWPATMQGCEKVSSFCRKN